ncbi:outer membrane protein assembly factor BamC [Alteromonas sp. ASW11-36]|uniref:Outer membrane protein assembly factor BamC n=1 Tax=Alteromonas arenosi TaxID=3055817 RepID=A0ABT7SX68_9ALTE|nr:outer membrane protein assembly factor BamC [Alteromonas sp. ASW11-36]MDM7860783.1 outer membrane protein assembly factor BamC [Alteromonas sp. ASW11-36]
MAAKSLTVAAVSVGLLAACASKEERELASGGFKYTEATVGQTVKIPADVDTPNFSKKYELPTLGESAPRDLVGRNLPVVSPSLVLPVVTGSHITEGTKTATVWFDKVDDSQPLDQAIWNSLLAFLEAQGIGVDSFDPETNRLVTDWMIISSEEESSWYDWTSTESQTGRRFEFTLDMKSHGRSAALNAELVDYLASQGDTATDSLSLLEERQEEVGILNQVISHYDYEIRLATSRKIQQIRQGLDMEMGFDADGNPAFMIDSQYDIAWPRVQLVLRKLGFDVKDLDKSNGLLFVTFAGEDRSWWEGWFSSENDMGLDEDDYRLQMKKAGARTSLTFMNEESVPFEANQVSAIFPRFSEVMSDNDLDIQ